MIGLDDTHHGRRRSNDEDSPDIDDAPARQVHPEAAARRHLSQGASDIHFEPLRKKFFRVVPSHRWHVDRGRPAAAMGDQANKSYRVIKVISRLDISEKRVPQDGRMKLVLNKNRSIDFRVSTLPTLYGEKIVMRILDSGWRSVPHRGAGLRTGAAKEPALRHRPSVRNDSRHRPHRQRQDRFAVYVSQHSESARRQHLHSRRSCGNSAGWREPSQRQRQGGPHLRGRAEIVPAAGSGHHHGRRNPRSRDRRYRAIVPRASRRPRGDARWLHTNDAPTTLTRMLNIGVAPFNIASSVQDFDHCAASSAANSVHAVQEAGGHPARGAGQQAGFLRDDDLDGSCWCCYGAPIGCDQCKGTGYKDARRHLHQVMPITDEHAPDHHGRR